jgi:hypothetical protein
MTNDNTAPIGELLTSAGLISEGQLQTALYDQQIYQDMRFGEILATRGWLSKQTVDFFCNVFQNGEFSQNKPLLGEYLADAGLINEKQIEQILEEQRINHLRFGALAVLKGYISQRTLDFFLQNSGSGSAKRDQYFQGSANPNVPQKPVNQEARNTAPQQQTRKTKDTPKTTTQPKYATASSGKSTQDVEINWI